VHFSAVNFRDAVRAGIHSTLGSSPVSLTYNRDMLVWCKPGWVKNS
jgi:hypothetical protein